jgi:hypothetical protein
VTTRLVVDVAKVDGALHDGWWRDRAGAARRRHDALLVADLPHDEIVLVLEGGAKGGVRAGRDAHVSTVHAARGGDDTIVTQARAGVEAGDRVTVVTADRMLQARIEAVGASALGPTWLLDRL